MYAFLNMLSIIIVSYKNNERTIAYVQEELSKVNVPHKVVVVNNSATSESNVELAKNLKAEIVEVGCSVANDSNVYIVNNPVNSGFAKGNNIGAKFAIDVLKAEYILFSNNDIKFIDSDVVERLQKKLEAFPDAGIIGPKVVGLKGELQSPEPYMSFWDRMVWMYASTFFLSKEAKAKRFKFNYSQEAKEGFHYKIMGSFFMVRSKDYANCGMMDENTFLYAEEPILTERMNAIGLHPYYYPEVAVLHDHGATTKKHLKKNKGSDIKFKSECYYYRKYMHTPMWQIWIGKIVHFLLGLK